MDSLTTFSKFYYGFEVTSDNVFINFDEGGGELTAEVSIGSFTMEEIAESVQIAMNAVAFTNTYTVTVNRDTRVFTISAANNFELLPVTGTQAGQGLLPTIGFTTDRTGDDTYAGDSAAGTSYSPQFRLQSYVPLEHWTGAALATVNKAANGRVELIKFGNESFMQANIMYINDYEQIVNNVLKTDPNGVDNVLAFLNYGITKGPMEFMPDEDDSNSFYKIILESTPDNKDGTSFKLNEMYDRGLPGWYETGILKFRQVVE